jgi:hypothetical protein
MGRTGWKEKIISSFPPIPPFLPFPPKGSQ